MTAKLRERRIAIGSASRREIKEFLVCSDRKHLR